MRTANELRVAYEQLETETMQAIKERVFALGKKIFLYEFHLDNDPDMWIVAISPSKRGIIQLVFENQNTGQQTKHEFENGHHYTMNELLRLLEAIEEVK